MAFRSASGMRMTNSSPAVPAGDVGVADVRAHRRRQVPDGLVAGRVPEGVVDQLEAVEVEHEHRERVAVALVELHVPVEFLLQVPAVVEAGERVGVGQAVEFGAGLLVIGLGRARHHPVQSHAA